MLKVYGLNKVLCNQYGGFKVATDCH